MYVCISHYTPHVIHNHHSLFVTVATVIGGNNCDMWAGVFLGDNTTLTVASGVSAPYILSDDSGPVPQSIYFGLFVPGTPDPRLFDIPGEFESLRAVLFNHLVSS